MNQKNNDSMTWIWLAILGLAILSALVSSSNNGSSTQSGSSYTSPASGVDRNSAEYRYAKERVKLEGYSDREAEQAADAIIKFHNAQQNR